MFCRRLLLFYFITLWTTDNNDKYNPYLNPTIKIIINITCNLTKTNFVLTCVNAIS